MGLGIVVFRGLNDVFRNFIFIYFFVWFFFIMYLLFGGKLVVCSDRCVLVVFINLRRRSKIVIVLKLSRFGFDWFG